MFINTTENGKCIELFPLCREWDRNTKFGFPVLCMPISPEQMPRGTFVLKLSGGPGEEKALRGELKPEREIPEIIFPLADVFENGTAISGSQTTHDNAPESGIHSLFYLLPCFSKRYVWTFLTPFIVNSEEQLDEHHASSFGDFVELSKLSWVVWCQQRNVKSVFPTFSTHLVGFQDQMWMDLASVIKGVDACPGALQHRERRTADEYPLAVP